MLVPSRTRGAVLPPRERESVRPSLALRHNVHAGNKVNENVNALTDLNGVTSKHGGLLAILGGTELSENLRS